VILHELYKSIPEMLYKYKIIHVFDLIGETLFPLYCGTCFSKTELV